MKLTAAQQKIVNDIQAGTKVAGFASYWNGERDIPTRLDKRTATSYGLENRNYTTVSGLLDKGVVRSVDTGETFESHGYTMKVTVLELI